MNIRMGRILTVTLTVGCIVAVTGRARGDTFTWDAGGGANTNWSYGANWTNTASPDTVPGAADDAVFNLTGTRTVNIGSGNQSISGITVTNAGTWTWSGTSSLDFSGIFNYTGSGSCQINAPLTGTGAVTVYAGQLALTNANTYSGGTVLTGGRIGVGDNAALGPGAISLGSGTIAAYLGAGDSYKTITNTVSLDGNTQLGHNFSSTRWHLDFTGPVTLTGDRILSVYGDSNGGRSTRFSSPINDGANSYGITLRAAGTGGGLILQTANTFDGGLRIEGGTVHVNHSQALGSGTFTVTNATAVHSQGATTITVGNAVQLDGSLSSSSGGSVNSVLAFSGAATLSGDRIVYTHSDGSGQRAFEFSGTLSDVGGGYRVTKQGGGTLYLSGNNSFNGVTVQAGMLSAAGTSTFPGGTRMESSTTLRVASGSGLGSGLLTLGGLGVYGGIGSYGGSYTATNSVLLTGSMYLQAEANSGVIDATARILTLGGPMMVDAPVPVWLSVATARETRFAGPISAPYTYSPGLIKSGSGTLVMSGDNTFDGGLRVENGILQLLGDNTAMSGGLTANSGTLWGRAHATGNAWGANAIAINPGATVWHEGLVATDTDTAVGTITFSGSGTLGVTNVTPGNTTTLTVNRLNRSNRGTLLVKGVTGTTSANLGKSEKIKMVTAPDVTSGMMAPYIVKPAVNIYADFVTYTPDSGITQVTYSASTDINSAGNAAIFSSTVGQTLTANREVMALQWQQLGGITNHNGYTLTLGSGGFIKWIGSSAQTYSGNMKFGTLGDREAVVYAGDGAGTFTMSGTISTTNGLTKIGPCQLILSGDNSATLAGPVTLNAGGIRLDSQNAVPDGVPLIINGSTFNLYGRSKNFAGITMGGGTLNNTSNQPVTVTLSGDVSYTPSGSGATIASAAGQLLNINLNGLRTFDIADGAAGNDMTFTAPLLGTAGYTKSGNGRLYLNTTNAANLSGPITIKGGTLWGQTFAGNGPFGATSSSITLTNNGAIALEGGNSTTNGAVTFAGGNLLLARNGQAGIAWRLASLARVPGSRGTLQASGDYLPGNENDHFDVNNSLFITAMAVTSRLPACIVYTYNQTYNNAALHAQYSNGGTATVKFRSASYSTVDINGSTATTLFNAATNQIMSNNRSCYYLRTAADISAAGAYTLTVAGEPGNEAGMIINGNNTLSPAVTFGADSAREGVVFVRYGRTGRLTGTVTTSGGLTKFGAGVLALSADNSATLTGLISVNQGTLRLENAAALAGSSPIRIEPGAMMAMTGSYTLQNAITGSGTIGTDTNVCTLGSSGSISPGASVGTLTAEKLDFRGTYNWEYDGTNSDLIACTTLAFGGSSATLDCSYLGGGEAPQGVYPLFTYKGSAPTLPSWNVTPPSGLSGIVSVDDANKRVILTLGPVPSGTIIIFR